MKEKKILALLLALVMFVGAMGVTTFATDETTAVAKLGDDQYFDSVSDALDAAYNADMKDVVITLMGDTNASTTDSIDIYSKYGATAFDNVTIRQDDPAKTYYLAGIYTGWRTDADGKFVFDGVNIDTRQFWAINKVELINNSVIKHPYDGPDYVFYGDTYIAPGSKYEGWNNYVGASETGSALIVDGGHTDGTINSTADYKTVWLYVNPGNSMIIKNGAYVVSSNWEYAEMHINGTVDVQDSRLDVYTAIRIGNGGVFKVDAGSSINTKEITGTGKLVIDAAGMNEGEIAAFKDVKMSGFTGDIELANAEGLEAKIVDGKISLAAKKVAKVGETEYASIEEALANWTAGTTLTLLSDAQLPDVFTLKSTEHHILDLSTYTLKAADGKNAFEITACGTGDAERGCLTIKADAANPGTLDAGKNSVVFYDYSKGGISGTDRPIIYVKGGNFIGSTSVIGSKAGFYLKGKEARKAATINISGGTFNCSIYGPTKSKVLISGGTFNATISSQGDTTAYRLISGGKFKSFGFMTSDTNTNKCSFGSAQGKTNAIIYIDEEGYYVVDSKNNTLNPADFEAATNSKWDSKFANSAINNADKMLYCKSAEWALEEVAKGTIKLLVDTDVDVTTAGSLTLDLTDANAKYTGTITLNKQAHTLTVLCTSESSFAGTVKAADGFEWANGTVATDENGITTITYYNTTDSIVANRDNTYIFTTLQSAVTGAKDGSTVKLMENVTENVTFEAPAISTLALNAGITLDLNEKTLTGAVVVENGANTHIKDGTIINNDANVSAITNAGAVTLDNVKIVSAANVLSSVDQGSFAIKSGEYLAGDGSSALTVGENASAEVSGGLYSTDVSAYTALGYICEKTIGGYLVFAGSELAESVTASLEKVTDNEYNVVLMGNDDKIINRFMSAEFDIDFTKTEGSLAASVERVGNVNIVYPEFNQDSDLYEFNLNGAQADITGKKIVVAKVVLSGYGKGELKLVAADGSMVNTEKGEGNNHVTTFTLTDGNFTVDTNAVAIELTAPTQLLTINVDFKNAISANAAAYQDMKITIFGGDLKEDIVFDLGDGAEWNNGVYTVKTDLVQNNLYNVVITGAGYRTARYTVKMDDNKVLNFWNDLKTVEEIVDVTNTKSAMKSNFLAGDIVMDEDINIYDLSAVVSYFGKTAPNTTAAWDYVKYDLDRNGKIDSKDVAYVLVSWED